MQEIELFCKDKGISHSESCDSYYFTLNNKNYRVSNHTIERSDSGMFDDMGREIRSSYHQEMPDICITAGKTRIIEIYNNLIAGKILDKRGNV